MTTFFAGDVLDAADLEMIYNPPTCYLVQQVAQTGWTSATETNITFGSGSTVVDTGALHSETGANPERILIGKKLGVWELSGVYCPVNQTNTTLVRSVLYMNGTSIKGGFCGLPFSSTTALIGISTPTIEVVATSSSDYVALRGYQTAASGTIGTAINSYVASSFRAVWKRPS